MLHKNPFQFCKPSDCCEAVVQMHIHSNFLNNKVTFKHIYQNLRYSEFPLTGNTSENQDTFQHHMHTILHHELRTPTYIAVFIDWILL